MNLETPKIPRTVKLAPSQIESLEILTALAGFDYAPQLIRALVDQLAEIATCPFDVRDLRLIENASKWHGGIV